MALSIAISILVPAGVRRREKTTQHDPTPLGRAYPPARASSEVGVVGEGPPGDVGLLVGEMVERMSRAPFVHLVVLVNVPRLRPRNSIEGSDRGAAQAGQRAEHGSLLLGNLRTLELVDHLVRLADARLSELLSGVLPSERLELSVGHLRVDVEAILRHHR